MMANVGMATTFKTVNQQKRRISNMYKKDAEGALSQYLNNALVLNVDDYHNIHVPHQPTTTATSRPTHMTTILMNPCPIPAIPYNSVVNPKFIDSDLLIKHLNERFIVNLGVLYHDRTRSANACTDEELIDRLVSHSYNNRLTEKKDDRHIRNSVLVDFTENKLKDMDGYLKALKIVYDQEPILEYLSNYAISVVAD